MHSPTRFSAAVAVVLMVHVASAQAPRRPFLFKDTRAEIALARARGERDLLVVIASMPGANARVARSIAAMGGTVQYRDDDVDYLRARVPIDKVDELAVSDDVHGVSAHLNLPAGGGGGGPQAIVPSDTTKRRTWPPQLSAYPLTNYWSPLGDLRALDFMRAHPTFDGRGTTLAIIDGSLDPLMPELQTAKTLEGRPTQKIVGYETAMDADEDDDGRWLRMTDSVVASGGSFKYRERSYIAPRDGRFHVDLLNEATFDSLSRTGLNKDLNRDGNPEGSSRIFAVLWDPITNDVWVDTDQDGSFANERALTDFSVRPEFGVFGKDNPATPVRESVGFAVQIDKVKRRVALNIGAASHASLIVGSAVASRGTNGRFDGVAPGAQLFNVAEGDKAYGQTEAVIRAVKNPKVDAVWTEQIGLITGYYFLRDGRSVTTVIYERLIAKYGKPILIPTHNYPVLGASDDMVLARGAIGVGGQEGKENFLVNHGVRVAYDDNLLVTGGYGPMGNGGFGPDVIAPSNFVSTNRGWEEAGGSGLMAGLYRLPVGYRIAGGSSTATPTAAGAVALLISAARQSGVKHDAYRIEQAITGSARYVAHLPAHTQGSGVLNVGGAWDLLRALDTLPMVTITARAPVRHVYSHMLATPNEGVGLYEREGWTAGDHRDRTIVFTRTTGPRDPMTFALNLTGNDARTFSAPTSVTLPLNQPVPVTVGIAPKVAGAHTAILTLDHASVPGHAHRMLLGIVAAEPLNSANGYSVQTKTEVPRPGMQSHFYSIPPGTSALRVDVDQPKREVAVLVVMPDTRTAIAIRTVGGGRGGGRGGGAGGAGRATYVVRDPMPGVWEVRLSDITDASVFDYQQGESDKPVPPTPAALTVSAIAADISASRDDVTITNRMAAFNGSVAGFTMGSAHRERPTIRAKQQQEYEIDVPAGSTSLMVRTSNVSSPAADLDVYLFNCTGRTCEAVRPDIHPATFARDPSGEEIVTIENPAAGKWKVIVDAANLPSGSATYDYVDVVFNPKYGAVQTTDLPVQRNVGERWSVAAHTWLAGALPAGRTAYPAVRLEGQLPGAVPFNLNVVGLVTTLPQ